MNKVFLRGNLTRDVELRYTTNNVAIGNFSIAVRRNSKNQDGEYESDFINCTAYQKLAETINKFFKKGSGIIIEGHIQTGSYEKDGKKVYTTDIIVERIEFDGKVSSKSESKSKENNEEPKEDPFETFGERVKIEENTESDLPF